MKKLLLVFLILAFAVPVFADDAITLPQGIIRTRIIPVYSFAREEFEDDFRFDFESKDADVDIFSLGFALEYGITDWITAALQWTPGVTLWSQIDADTPGDATVGTWFDLFAGAKFQVVGPNAPVPNDQFRVAFAPGVKIPFASTDWDDQDPADDFIVANADNNVLGVGGRFYADYVVSPSFFLNFYSEAIFYPIEGEAPSYELFATVQTLNENFGPQGVDLPDDEFGYGYDLTFEIEPHYIYQASPDLRISASLPLTYSFTPEPTLGGDKLSDIELDVITPDGPATLQPFEGAGPSSRLSIQPKVEFFFTGLTVPTALEVGYRRVIAGENADALNAVVIQIKNYLAF